MYEVVVNLNKYHFRKRCKQAIINISKVYSRLLSFKDGVLHIYISYMYKAVCIGTGNSNNY